MHDRVFWTHQGVFRMIKLAVRLWLLLSLAAAFGNVFVLAESSPAIRLAVDATQAPQKILRVHEVIPAAPGPLTLFYPKWIQGVHAPASRIIFSPTLQLPAGWKFGTALLVENQSTSEIAFQSVALDCLLDSPLIAGE